MNEEHRQNLETLATYLETAPPREFHMGEFRAPADDPYESLEFGEPEPECATVACVIGSGPYAGIPLHPDDTDWWTYAERIFGIVSFTPEWTWLFRSEWAKTDNTPTGAAKRIRYFLKHGVPDDALDQMKGTASYVCA